MLITWQDLKICAFIWSEVNMNVAKGERSQKVNDPKQTAWILKKSVSNAERIISISKIQNLHLSVSKG